MRHREMTTAQVEAINEFIDRLEELNPQELFDLYITGKPQDIMNSISEDEAIQEAMLACWHTWRAPMKGRAKEIYEALTS